MSVLAGMMAAQVASRNGGDGRALQGAVTGVVGEVFLVPERRAIRGCRSRVPASFPGVVRKTKVAPSTMHDHTPMRSP
jgi:hypothetical protein